MDTSNMTNAEKNQMALAAAEARNPSTPYDAKPTAGQKIGVQQSDLDQVLKWREW